MFTIKDGKGSGNKVEVNSDNELVVTSIKKRPIEYATAKGDAYCWYTSDYSFSSNDTVMLVKNLDSDILYMDRIVLSCTTTTSFTIHIPGGIDKLSGSTTTDTNLQAGNTKSAKALGYYSETNNWQSGSLMHVKVRANETVTVDMGGLSIMSGNGIGVDVNDDLSGGGYTASCSVFGYYLK